MKKSAIGPHQFCTSRYILDSVLAGMVILTASGPALGSALMALDKGCMGCHGNPPRNNTPSMQQLAADYAKYRDQPGAAHKLALKLREGGLFGHIAAHERLSLEDSERLMQWIIDGAK